MNLELLTLDFNPIVSLPTSIGNLKKLEVLPMMYTQIQEFPREFGDLKQLKRLDLTRRSREELKVRLLNSIRALPSLESIRLLECESGFDTEDLGKDGIKFVHELVRHKPTSEIYRLRISEKNSRPRVFSGM